MPESYGGSFTDPSENLALVASLRGQHSVLSLALLSIAVLGLRATSSTASNLHTKLQQCGQLAKEALESYLAAEPIIEVGIPDTSAETLNFSTAGFLKVKIRVFAQTLKIIQEKAKDCSGYNSSASKFPLEWCSTQARNALDFTRVDAGGSFGEPAAPGG